MGGARGEVHAAGRATRRARLGVLICALLGGCLPEGDARCGPRQDLVDGICVCEAGTRAQGHGCVAVDAGPPPPVGGLGTACGAEAPCAHPDFPLCQGATEASEGFCTRQGCTTASDCGYGFGCATAASPTHCRKPYTGQKAMCKSDADCAGYDAKYCLTILSVCIVVDCTEHSCDPDWSCFDLSTQLAGLPKACVSNADLAAYGQ
ncbi:MAG: hypothetical protein ABW252_06085 [Polyangiales bacterium]